MLDEVRTLLIDGEGWKYAEVQQPTDFYASGQLQRG